MKVYMQDVVTLLDTATDKYGEPGVVTETSADARVQYEQKLVQLATGEKVQSMAAIHFAGDPAVTLNTRVLLPGETTTDGNGHQILQITKRADFQIRGIKVRIA